MGETSTTLVSDSGEEAQRGTHLPLGIGSKCVLGLGATDMAAWSLTVASRESRNAGARSMRVGEVATYERSGLTLVMPTVMVTVEVEAIRPGTTRQFGRAGVWHDSSARFSAYHSRHAVEGQAKG